MEELGDQDFQGIQSHNTSCHSVPINDLFKCVTSDKFLLLAETGSPARPLYLYLLSK